MADCPESHAPVEESARFGPRRGGRRPFWFFAAAMLVAVAGGGAVVVMVKKTSADRRGFARDPEVTVASPEPVRPQPVQASPPTPEPKPPVTQPAPVAQPRPDARPADHPPAKDPARAAALFRRAERRRAAQDVNGAIPLYLAALEADPGLAEAHEKLARCYQLRGDRKKAADRYRRYLATHPPDADRVRSILGTLE